MSKESLQGMTKEELTAKAKELNLPRYKNGKKLTKAELIDSIVEAQVAAEDAVEKEVTQNTEEVVGVTEVNSGLSDEERAKRHNSYVENVKVGTLVAFKTGPNKAKSAMVVKRSTKNRKLKVETKYGKEFIISFDDVIWVHTNKRWPKGVYNMLKGKVDENEGTDAVN